MNVVLASGSPRRKELMEMLGFDNLIIMPAKKEEVIPADTQPGRTVEILAESKCREVAELQKPEDLIIAADTIVWIDGRILGKPHSRAEAKSMLTKLSGRTHEVYTGVCVIYNGKTTTVHEKTSVSFRELAEEEIEAYIETGEPMDKAGAYGAQGRGALFVRHIDGDFFNVMGLPVCRLGEILRNQGVDII